jgi:hypothetical protein
MCAAMQSYCGQTPHILSPNTQHMMAFDSQAHHLRERLERPRQLKARERRPTSKVCGLYASSSNQLVLLSRRFAASQVLRANGRAWRIQNRSDDDDLRGGGWQGGAAKQACLVAAGWGLVRPGSKLLGKARPCAKWRYSAVSPRVAYGTIAVYRRWLLRSPLFSRPGTGGWC